MNCCKWYLHFISTFCVKVTTLLCKNGKFQSFWIKMLNNLLSFAIKKKYAKKYPTKKNMIHWQRYNHFPFLIVCCCFLSKNCPTFFSMYIMLRRRWFPAHHRDSLDIKGNNNTTYFDWKPVADWSKILSTDLFFSINHLNIFDVHVFHRLHFVESRLEIFDIFHYNEYFH